VIQKAVDKKLFKNPFR